MSNAAEMYSKSRFGRAFEKAYNTLPRSSTGEHAYAKRVGIDFATACAYYWATGERA